MNQDVLMGKLQEKLDANYRDYLNRSSAWSLQERREHTEEIQDTELAYAALLKAGGTEPELRYLLHFKNPLRIVADQLVEQRTLGCPEGDDPLQYALWRILNTRDADIAYELEDAFQTPDVDAEDLLDELAGRAEAEYKAYLAALEKLPKAALISKSTETADMKRLLSTFVNDSYGVEKAGLCFICRAESPLREFYDFLCNQEELSVLDSFDSILSAYNEKFEEATLLGEWGPAAPPERPAPLPDDPEDWPEFLRERIDAEYEALEQGWLGLLPSELIERAQEIGGVQLLQVALSEYDFEEDDVENLLRFPDPLSKAAKYWTMADGPTTEDIHHDLPYVLSSLAENEPWPERLEQSQPGGPSLC